MQIKHTAVCGISNRQCCNYHHSPQDQGHQEHVLAASVHPLRACWVFHLRWYSCTSPAPFGRAETWLLLLCSALLLRISTSRGTQLLQPCSLLTIKHCEHLLLAESPGKPTCWGSLWHLLMKTKQQDVLAQHRGCGTGGSSQGIARMGSVYWGQSKQQLPDTDKEIVSNFSFCIEI